VSGFARPLLTNGGRRLVQNGKYSSNWEEKFLTFVWALRQKGMPARHVTVERETPILLPRDLRDLGNVSLEWMLVTLSHNVRRLHTIGAVLQTA
jgi:hypothetical protein